MELHVRRRDPYTIIDIDGDINELDNFNKLKEAILDLIKKGEINIGLNLANTTFLNSSAVSLFISWQKKIAADNGKMVIFEPPPFIMEILRILCIEKIIPVHTSEDTFFSNLK
ncbi:MAG: STAS domain-containing protein [Fibrobacteres bacterium]|nr:STAS domain-containing protein [Fibrobacterota bacterium]